MGRLGGEEAIGGLRLVVTLVLEATCTGTVGAESLGTLSGTVGRLSGLDLAGCDVWRGRETDGWVSEDTCTGTVGAESLGTLSGTVGRLSGLDLAGGDVWMGCETDCWMGLLNAEMGIDGIEELENREFVLAAELLGTADTETWAEMPDELEVLPDGLEVLEDTEVEDPKDDTSELEDATPTFIIDQGWP